MVDWDSLGMLDCLVVHSGEELVWHVQLDLRCGQSVGVTVTIPASPRGADRGIRAW